jgi:hypothetical protein
MFPTEKTTKVFDYRKLNCLIYGVPKIGKTTFCSSLDAGNVLFLDTEGGTKHIEAFVEPCAEKSFDQIQTFVRNLLTHEHPFNLVIIDTVSKLYDKAVEQVCNELMCDTSSGKFTNNGRGWGRVNALMKQLIAMLIAGNFGCYFVDHEAHEDLDTEGNVLKFADPYKGRRVTRFKPAMSGKAGSALQAGVDMILRCSINQEGQRIVQSRPQQTVIAGGRYSDLLPEVFNLSADDFVGYFRNAHKSHKERAVNAST